MYALQEAKQQVLKELKRALGKGFSPAAADLAVPPNPEMGDVAFPCFALAKALKRSPVEIAAEIAAKIGPKGYVKSAVAQGPYVNFTFDTAALGQAVLAQIDELGDAYGRSETGAGKRVMVEYANPNTHKDVHIGHLRNFFVGQSLVNSLEAAGYDVVPVSYINDLGAHVAICLWGVKNLHQGALPPEGEDPVTFMGRMYAEATAVAKENPAVKEEISAIHRDLEDRRGAYLSLWRKTRQWSLAYMRGVFRELKLPLRAFYYESDLIDAAKAVVEDLIKKGIARHSNSAWIVDLEAEKLGVNLLVKSDGTLLYNAKDLALALRKRDEFHPKRSLYVVDARQSLAMNQLFATLRKMGRTEELAHVSYDFVTLKEGAMSSRKGNIIRYEFFRDAMVEEARTQTAARHPDWKPARVEKTARAIAFAAIRFGMLKQDTDRKIIFDMEEALSFEGFTGPYLLYTLARVNGIMKKARRRKRDRSASRLALPSEKRLVAALAAYPDAVRAAATDTRLGALAQHLFDIAKRFAEFYAEAPVLAAEDAAVAAQRLALCEAAGRTLENGLALLGIDAVKEM